jgi:hypothetical protein
MTNHRLKCVLNMSVEKVVYGNFNFSHVRKKKVGGGGKLPDFCG